MFQADRQWDLPNKDILSYIFDKPAYDQDKPVCGRKDVPENQPAAKSNNKSDLRRRP
jgi:hypothetical protein